MTDLSATEIFILIFAILIVCDLFESILKSCPLGKTKDDR